MRQAETGGLSRSGECRGMKTNDVKTCYVPWVSNNMYTDNVRRLLAEAGFPCYSIKSCLKNPALFVQCRIFNFNWFEKAENRRTYLAKLALLRMLKLFGKKIVYTLHNKRPHNTDANDYSTKLMIRMCEASDAIVGLCRDTFSVVEDLSPESKEKVRIIPHPNYVYNYNALPCQDYRKKYGFEEDSVVFLFLGFISPYKNVETLIETIKQIQNGKIKLLIAGRPCDEAYRAKLLSLAGKDNNIVFDFRYIPDEEIASFYNTADIVVMPYQKTSSLNSGAVYLSFSLGKTVICPDIGTIKDLKSKSFVYDYTYETDSEHSRHLREAILQAIEDFDKDPELVKEKGQEALAYVTEHHSDQLIEKQYLELYDSLIH